MVKAAAPVACDLCGLPTSYPLHDDDGRAFCCPSCLEVYHLLHEHPPEVTTPSGNGTQPATAGDSVVISLGGMWCTSCAWLIEETLERTPGVASVQVNFVRREARVDFNPEQVDASRLKKRVRRLGYRAWLPGEQPHDEEEATLNRLLIGGVLAMHVMLISFMLYARTWLGWASPDTQWLADFFHIMLFVASLPLMLLLGLPILRAGVASLLRKQPNMHTLIAIGAFSAFALSVRNLFLGIDRVYFDTASMLLFLVTVGHWLEIRARKVGNEAVERLWQRVPQEATWITAEGERRVPVDELPKGARVRVRPGEHFPVDGVVAEGEGEVDESLLTGEPTPVLRRPGDTVRAGTINLDGAFEVITTAVGAETVVGQIGRLLHQALWQRSPVERLADRLAAWMVPTAVLIAAGTFAFWSRQVGVETGLMHALSVLLIACPCALGLATPLTLWIALGRATEEGVLIQHTGVLERLAQVRTVLFDKTGTLTQRPLRLHRVATAGPHISEEEVLRRAAAVEALSEHPLAQAVLYAAEQQGLAYPRVSEFRAWPGRGVSARLGETLVWVGNEPLMADQGMAVPAHLAEVAARWREEGLRVVFVGWDDEVVGVLGLGEAARPEVTDVLHYLQAMGLEVAVLTGDDPAAGERWQALLGVPVHAGLQPEEKMRFLEGARRPVAMVGDGINDGPALAAADVGITLSDGTDVAREAAEVILLDDNLWAIPRTMDLARTAMRRVRQNLGWAFVYNVLGIGLAVSGRLQPVLAALAMVLSSLIVTGNALRIRRHTFHSTRQG